VQRGVKGREGFLEMHLKKLGTVFLCFTDEAAFVMHDDRFDHLGKTWKEMKIREFIYKLLLTPYKDLVEWLREIEEEWYAMGLDENDRWKVDMKRGYINFLNDMDLAAEFNWPSHQISEAIEKLCEEMNICIEKHNKKSTKKSTGVEDVLDMKINNASDVEVIESKLQKIKSKILKKESESTEKSTEFEELKNCIEMVVENGSEIETNICIDMPQKIKSELLKKQSGLVKRKPDIETNTYTKILEKKKSKLEIEEEFSWMKYRKPFCIEKTKKKSKQKSTKTKEMNISIDKPKKESTKTEEIKKSNIESTKKTTKTEEEKKEISKN
jgi:hypothetical protein